MVWLAFFPREKFIQFKIASLEAEIFFFWQTLAKVIWKYFHFWVQVPINRYMFGPVCTMLQKLSKCEVKAWLCWHLIILLSLWFWVKSYFGQFKRSKNVIFGHFRTLNFGLESCSNWQKSKFLTSKIAKMTFLDCLNSPKFDFIQNLSGGKIIKFQQSQALTSHFESFWSIVGPVWFVNTYTLVWAAKLALPWSTPSCHRIMSRNLQLPIYYRQDREHWDSVPIQCQGSKRN